MNKPCLGVGVGELHTRSPAQRDKVRFPGLLYQDRTRRRRQDQRMVEEEEKKKEDKQDKQVGGWLELTLLEASGFSRVTLANIFFSRLSSALSSAPW